MACGRTKTRQGRRRFLYGRRNALRRREIPAYVERAILWLADRPALARRLYALMPRAAYLVGAAFLNAEAETINRRAMAQARLEARKASLAKSDICPIHSVSFIMCDCQDGPRPQARTVHTPKMVRCCPRCANTHFCPKDCTPTQQPKCGDEYKTHLGHVFVCALLPGHKGAHQTATGTWW